MTIVGTALWYSFRPQKELARMPSLLGLRVTTLKEKVQFLQDNQLDVKKVVGMWPQVLAASMDHKSEFVFQLCQFSRLILQLDVDVEMQQ